MPDFHAWLSHRGYRPTTARVYARSTARARDSLALGELPLPSERYPLRAYVGFLDATGAPGDAVDARIRTWLDAPEARAPRPRTGPVRGRPAPFAPDDWERLCEALAVDGDPESRVLEVQTATGLRTGDVLRLRRPELDRAYREGGPRPVLDVEVKGGRTIPVPLYGAPDVWRRLRDGWTHGATVAEWVSPSANRDIERAAYMQCRKHLQFLGRALGLQGRINPHRIRHTVANLALGETKDIHMVKALLGHASLSSTSRYLDDRTRVDDVATLQRALGRRSARE